MNKWVINFEDDQALKEIKKIGNVLFEPEFDDLRFIAMETNLSKDSILSIGDLL